MSRKKKNKIDVDESRKFLWEAYGMKSTVVNFYELMILHEEFRAKFHWYHTTGKLLCITQDKNGDQAYRDLVTLEHGAPFFTEAEQVALAINHHVYKTLKKNPGMYWDKSIKKNHREGLKQLINKVHSNA